MAKKQGIKVDLPPVGIKVDLPEEVIAVYEDAARISKIDFNTVINVVLAVFIASRRSPAATGEKPVVQKKERKAKSK